MSSGTARPAKRKQGDDGPGSRSTEDLREGRSTDSDDYMDPTDLGTYTSFIMSHTVVFAPTYCGLIMMRTLMCRVGVAVYATGHTRNTESAAIRLKRYCRSLASW